VVRVAWTRRAAADLVAIRTYIGWDSPLAGRRTAQRLKTAGDSLGDFPERGRLVGEGVRELAVIYPYIIRYVVRAGQVRILRIKHGAQDPGA
jgi:plasmid stabilization system protein ParE